MNNSKKLLLTATAAVLFSTTAPVQAAEPVSTALKLSLAQKAFGAAFFASLLRYNIRRGDNNPSRCNFERLKNSVMGTLNEKNNTITCTILGYDLARADKKELKAIVVGIRTEQNELVPLTKIEILKIDRSDLKKACESRVLDETPACAANNGAVQAEYWIKPELTCKVKLFAINRTEHNAPVSYVVIDPQFVDMAKNKPVATEQELAALHTTQAVSTGAIANEIWGIIDDGIIGHAGKAGGAEADLATGKLIGGSATAPKGIYGHIQHYWRPLGLAATTYGTIWAIQNPKAASQALLDAKFMLAPILTYAYNTLIPKLPMTEVHEKNMQKAMEAKKETKTEAKTTFVILTTDAEKEKLFATFKAVAQN